MELLGQLAEFDLFASKRSDVTVRRDQQKDPEQNLRAVIQRILTKPDSIAGRQAAGASGGS